MFPGLQNFLPAPYILPMNLGCPVLMQLLGGINMSEMQIEIDTMKLLANQSSIPVPRVHATNSCQNSIHLPWCYLQGRRKNIYCVRYSNYRRTIPDGRGLLQVLGMDRPRWCRGVAGGNPGNPENPESRDTCINMPISTHSSVTNLLHSSAYRSAPTQTPTTRRGQRGKNKTLDEQ